ncbi:MAG: hypothetical protein K6B38_04620, partial [Ruminococcus sp.]|nr:hypothetical protein [Ruminococcus sp.]
MKKIHKRFVSVLTATVMMSNLMPLDEMLNLPIRLPKFPSLSRSATIKANAMAASAFTPGTITFDTASDFVDYCSYFADDTCMVTVGETTKTFADAHKDDVLFLTFGSDTTDRGTIPSGFVGLGNDDYAFNGEIHLPDNGYGYFELRTYAAPLFSYVNDSVKILSGSKDATTDTYPEVKIQFRRLANVGNAENNPLFASHVLDGSATSANWNVELTDDNTNTYSGVIGEIESGASVKLTYADNSTDSNSNVFSSSDVGAVCGTMQSGSSMELTYSALSDHSITTSGGNAGGLVGAMNGDASLTINAMPTISLSAESTYAYAGGLVGELTSQATITNQTSSLIPVSGIIKGVSGSGGLFGHYTNSASEFDLAGYNNTATVDGQFSGGVFGVLENTSSSFTIKNTSNAGTLSVSSGATGDADGYFGGMAGKYTTNALSNSLVLDGLTLTAAANAAYSAFGGAIGIVDPAAYVQTTNTVSVTATGTARSTYFGGLVGATSGTNGVFIDLGNFTLNTGSEEFKGGGVVGLFNNGVLRLSGTTDMTNAKPASAANCGQLVGSNNNVLTYATSGWSFNRSSGATTDDLGTWGEVVRVAESDIVTVDSTAHTVTLKAAETSMGIPAAFTKTALNIQLNQGSDYDCLKFTSGNNTRSYLLGTGLSLSADISLSNTGITGFMRDGGDVSTIGSFTGTFDGNNHTLTLAIGEKYGNGVTASTNSEGVGQIYRHQHNGLFSVLAGTVKDLTVDGMITLHNCNNEINVNGAATMNIGGIAAQNSGYVTLNGVNTNVTVNYDEPSDIAAQKKDDVTYNPSKNIGGYIGYVGENGDINITGTSSIGARFDISGYHKLWNVYGGAIGKITAGNFTVNIGTNGEVNNKLTNSLTVDVSGVTNSGDNSDSGGLIGYITSAGSYGSRTVNLNNVEFTSCTVGNAASKNGGGFLGYAWLNTSTNVNGVTVTSGTINNSTAPNVG